MLSYKEIHNPDRVSGQFDFCPADTPPPIYRGVSACPEKNASRDRPKAAMVLRARGWRPDLWVVNPKTCGIYTIIKACANAC